MTNLADAVYAHANQDPQRVAVRSGDRLMTFGTLRDLVSADIARAAAANIAPGDRVVLIGPSIPEFVVAYYGLHAAGAVLITMNVMATAPEIDYMLADSDAALVVAWSRTTAAASTAAGARGIPVCA